MQSALPKTLDAVTQEAAVHGPRDEELMASIQAEEPNALDLLFTRYSRLVFGVALRILHDAGEAEEVVQECFLYIYRKAKLFEPARGSAKVWIVQVAYSRARDRKAHLSRRGFYLRADIDTAGLNDTLAGSTDVEREIESKLDFLQLQGAFEDLTRMQRETLKLFYFEELELREISQRLQEPLGNIRHHFYRGLERLRKSAVIQGLRQNHDAKNR